MKQKRIAECKCNSLAPYSGKEVNGKIEYGKNLMKYRKIYLAVSIGCLLMAAIYYQIESHFLINRNPFFYIYTLDNTSEMMLAVLSAAAQEESHTDSCESG